MKRLHTYFILFLCLLSCGHEEPYEDTKSEVHTASYRAVPVSELGDGFVLLELFTSESCYDCPPSEEALNEFVSQQNPNQRNVLAVSVHVDYWNDLIYGEGDCKGNWVDQFSTGENTARQFNLTQVLDARPVTPQLIGNGTNYINDPQLADFDSLAHASDTTKNFYKVNLGLVDYSSEDLLTISFELKQITQGDAEFRNNMSPQLHVILLEDGVSTKPDKGENCGEHLVHDHLLRALSVKTIKGSNKGTLDISYPRDVRLENCQVAAFVHNMETQEVVGGTQGFRFEVEDDPKSGEKNTAEPSEQVVQPSQQQTGDLSSSSVETLADFEPVLSENKSFRFTPGSQIRIDRKTSDAETITGITFIEAVAPEAEQIESIDLSWKQLSNDVPSDWHLYFCDNVVCYFNFPEMANLNPISILDEQENNRMKLYVEHNDIPGKGKVQVEVMDLNDPSSKDTITYHINIQ